MSYIPKSAFKQRKKKLGSMDPKKTVSLHQRAFFFIGFFRGFVVSSRLSFRRKTMDLEASLVSTTDGEKPEAATTSHAC